MDYMEYKTSDNNSLHLLITAGGVDQTYAKLWFVNDSQFQTNSARYIYFDNNINSTINILRIAEEYAIPNFVFSSSCSVYGNTTELPVNENTPLSSPESPYGWTKLIAEQMIE